MTEHSPGLGVLLALHRRMHVLRTVHALPFVAIGAVLAAEAWPRARVIVFLAFCVLFGRGFLVALSRYFHAPPDVSNPDADEGLEREEIPAAVWWVFILHTVGGLVLFAYLLNPLTGHMSWALVVLLILTAAVRPYTGLSHLLLAAGLGVTPLGGWLALRGTLDVNVLPCLIVGAGVVAWVAGFDMVYSLLPEFREGDAKPIFAKPMAMSRDKVFDLATALHVTTCVLFVFAGFAAGLGTPYYIGAGATAICLVIANRSVRPDDLSRVRGTFANLNLLSGWLLLAGTAVARSAQA